MASSSGPNELDDVKGKISKLEAELETLKPENPERLLVRRQLAALQDKEVLLLRGAGGPTPSTPTTAMVRLKELLHKGGISRVEQKVQDQIQWRFPMQLLTVDTVGQARDLYDAAKVLPGRTTAGFVRQELGISINGQLPGQSRPNLLSAVHGNGSLMVIKVLDSTVLDRQIELQMCEKLGLVSPDVDVDESVSVFIQAKTVQVSVNTDPRHPDGTLDAVLMNRYMCILSELPQLNFAAIYAGGKRILQALEHVHSEELVYMDLKADNIFLNQKGQWFLGDFGSVCRVGHPIRTMTAQYYPEQLIGLPRAGDQDPARYNETAKYEFDYYMLVVTLMSVVLKEAGGEERLMGTNGRVSRVLVAREVHGLPEGELKGLITMIMDRSVLPATS